MKEKKKIFLFGIGGLLVLFLVIGVSYAIWQIILQQTNENVVTTGCFKINFTEKNDINLNNAYPIEDEAGRTLTPYEFTIENTCDNEASYQVNLEVLDTTTLENLSFIKVMYGENTPKILTNYSEVQKTLDNATTSYKLEIGDLAPKETKTFTLRLWMDYDTPPTSDAMNKIFKSKVTVITSYKEESNNIMKSIDVCYDIEGAHNCLFAPSGESITKVAYENKINPYENAENIVDFSEEQDKSVLGYYIKNEDNTYELYIQADGKIKINPNASYFFLLNSYYQLEGIENLDFSLVTDASYMFEGYGGESLDLSSFNATNVTDISFMFSNCHNLTSLDLSSFDTSNVINMDSMFLYCSSLTSLDLSEWDSSKVTNMDGMFSGCSSLINLDLSLLDTTNVTSMSRMFNNCRSLTNLDLSSLNTTNVINMGSMFSSCTSLTTITYGNNFIYKDGAITTNMFLNCPANKPTHESWNGVFS